MPEALDYSVASMIAVLWLAARARGLGLGWVSILDPEQLAADLGAPRGLQVHRLSLPRLAGGGA